jgi:hypothetical protein
MGGNMPNEEVCIERGGVEPEKGRCEDTWFLFASRGCEAPVDGGACWESGDGLCYQSCESDADCTDSCAPHCVAFAFFHGGDYTTDELGCAARR